VEETKWIDMKEEKEERDEGREDEEFFTHYKNNLKRHAHTLSGDRRRGRREFNQRPQEVSQLAVA
jgi:hypothetical protein